MQPCGMTAEQQDRIVERCLDDGARQVAALNEFATASDQRAVTVASVYIGAATAIAAGLIGWFAQGSPPHDLVAAGVVTSGLFYVAAMVCLWTAFPQRTLVAGNPPEFWRWHLKYGSSYSAALLSQVEEYDRKISLNSKARATAAWWYRGGAILGAAAPAIGVAMFFAVRASLL